MPAPRVLLIGAGGQLGQELCRCLAPAAVLIPCTRTGAPVATAPSLRCEALDLREPDKGRQLIARLRPDVVINAAAYNSVEQAEQDAASAWAINCDAVGALAEACSLAGARLVHYSTDYVFSGDGDRPWREDDRAVPLNVYGASKLAGEEAVLASGCRHMIFRIAWLYAAHSHNFLRTMLRLAREGTPIRVVDDQCGTPTHARWVADITTRILASGAELSGTWHMAPDGRTTWFGFAREIFRAAAAEGLLEKAPQLVAVDSAGFPAVAPRPSWSVLDTSKLQHDFGVVPPDWREGVTAALRELAGRESRPRDS